MCPVCSTPTAADNRSTLSDVSGESRPASRASSLDVSGLEHQQARAGAQTGPLVCTCLTSCLTFS